MLIGRSRDSTGTLFVTSTFCVKPDDITPLRLPPSKYANEMPEQFFDRIATNAPSVPEMNIVGDLKSPSLTANQNSKTGAAFVNNTHVKMAQMNQVELDDKICKIFRRGLGYATCQIEKNLV